MSKKRYICGEEVDLRFLDGVDDELKPDEKELNGRSNAKKIRLKVCRVPEEAKG